MKTTTKYLLLILLLINKISVTAQINQYSWATQIGDVSANALFYDYDQVKDVSTDFQGNVYCVGFFNGHVDFDPGPSTYYLNSGNSETCFIVKYDSLGNFLWVKTISNSVPSKNLIDNGKNIYIVGMFNGITDFDPSSNTYQLNTRSATIYNIYLSKLDSAGNFIFAEKLTAETSASLCISKSNNIYICGSFRNTAFLDPTAKIHSFTSISGWDGLLVRWIQSLQTEVKDVNTFTNSNVYPNPSNGKFLINNLQLNNIIEIYNTNSELILSKIILDTDEIIELTTNAKGIYFYKIFENKQNEIKRGKIII